MIGDESYELLEHQWICVRDIKWGNPHATSILLERKRRDRPIKQYIAIMLFTISFISTSVVAVISHNHIEINRACHIMKIKTSERHAPRFFSQAYFSFRKVFGNNIYEYHAVFFWARHSSFTIRKLIKARNTIASLVGKP